MSVRWIESPLCNVIINLTRSNKTEHRVNALSGTLRVPSRKIVSSFLLYNGNERVQ